MASRHQIKTLLFLLFLTTSYVGIGQATNTQARYRALFINTFSDFTDYPSQYKNGSFVIGVYGDDKVYDELVKNNVSRTKGSQPIKVVKYNGVSDMDRCHVLYVAPDNSSKISEIVKKFKTSSTLIITESAGLLKSGAVVNFVIVNNRINYEISKSNASKYNLYIGSTITDKALKVE